MRLEGFGVDHREREQKQRERRDCKERAKVRATVDLPGQRRDADETKQLDDQPAKHVTLVELVRHTEATQEYHQPRAARED